MNDKEVCRKWRRNGGRHGKKQKLWIFFYVLLFFLLSLVGWLWEIAIYLVQDGRFVNRGILLGPWLPVYGSGGLLLILVFSADAAWAADFPNMGEGITARINTVP
ncbi:hypothetical protein D3Z45_14660 [Lachnospiraceae bacterium]|nr:hypothetical protein [Lachnospiraceae bacterium]